MRHSFKKYSLNWAKKALHLDCNGRMPKKNIVFQKETITLKTYINY